MSIERAPILTSLDPDTFTEGTLSGGTSSTNVLYSKYADGRPYATQRPAVNITHDPADQSIAQSNGRGMHFFTPSNLNYWVTKEVIYAASYSGPLATTFSTSTDNKDKVFMTEVGEYLVIVDPQANEAITIKSDALFTGVKITDVNFPPNQTPAKQLVGGAVSIDGFLFVMTDDGIIYNSNLNDPTTWNALDFIGSDISEDNGVCIVKHHNNVCAIGTGSIEFFYNVGNPVGSPLQRRQDIFHLTGAVDFNVVSETGDEVFFLGRAGGDTVNLYILDQFQVISLSRDTMNSYIDSTYQDQSATAATMTFWLSSTWIGEHLLCFMTAMDTESTAWKPIQTNVYDHSTNLWSTFVSDLVAMTGLGSVHAFGVAVVSAAGKTNSLVGQIIMTSGAIVKLILEDTIDTDALASPETSNIEFELITPEVDFDTMTNKYIHRLSIVGRSLKEATNLDDLGISWTDDRYTTFSTSRDLETNLRRSLPRCGKFKRRAFKITYSGVDRLRLEALELDLRISGYA